MLQSCGQASRRWAYSGRGLHRYYHNLQGHEFLGLGLLLLLEIPESMDVYFYC